MTTLTSPHAQVEEASHSTTVTRYAPSWVDHLTGWVRRLPVPAWMVYAAAAAVVALWVAVTKWLDGSYPPGEFFPLHVLAAANPLYLLALMHYLDDWAVDALEASRPAMRIDEAEYERLRYELTNMPARPTLTATIVGSLYGFSAFLVFSPEELARLKLFTSPLATVTELAWATVPYSLAVVYLYHTVHQLRLVSHIYTHHARADLFNMGPLYSFARLAARTAIGIAIPVYAWAAVLEQFGTGAIAGNTASLVQTGFFVLVILVVFLSPLVGIHRMLAAEKTRLRGEIGQNIKAAMQELLRRREAGEYARMGEVNIAIDQLTKTQSLVDKIPTWPWHPETLRSLGATLLLPVIVRIITRFLEQLVKV